MLGSFSDLFDDALATYLAPWRRFTRLQFALAATLASLPGVLFWGLGLAESAGGLVNSATSFTNNLASFTTTGALPPQLTSLLAPEAASAPPIRTIDWLSIFNNLLFLALTPAVAARLLDIGRRGTIRWVLTGLFQASLLLAILAEFGLKLPYAWFFGALNFVGYTWLCLASSAPRPPRGPQPPSSETDELARL